MLRHILNKRLAMSDVTTIIKYDGLATAGKSIDISDLAPSLIAISELIKAANYQFNGDRAAVKILVNANVEQNCFELKLHLAQTIWDTISNLITEEKIKTAAEIAKYIGIIGGAGVTLIKLQKLLKNQKVESVTKIPSIDGSNNFSINIFGNNNSIVVSQEVAELYNNKTIRDKVSKIVKPLEVDGYDSVTFYDGKVISDIILKGEISSDASDEYPEIYPQNIVKSTIRTGVRIRKAIYEGKAKWTIVYKKAIEAPIDDDDWLNKFQSNEIVAAPNSVLEVNLEETVVVNSKGEAVEEPTYKIIKVIRVVPPSKQHQLFE